MTWFTENPTPPVVLGIIIEAVLVVVLMKTASRTALWAMLLTAVVTAVAVVTNILIVTPREEVTAALEEMRVLVEQNDRAALIDRIDRSAVQLRNQVQTELAQLTVAAAKINDLKVLVDPSGTSAKTEFIGVIDFKDSAGGRIPGTHIVLQFEVTLQKVGDRWLITNYRWDRPTIGGSGGAALPARQSIVEDHIG